MNIADLRQEYMRETLNEADVADHPIAQFHRWFDEAVQAQMPLVNAMTLATTGPGGHPSARIVLLKDVDDSGFVFYTDYHSRKGRELEVNPHAALLFHWIELEREVRIEGHIEHTSAVESDVYFASRPLGSRYAASASLQSTVVPNREFLEARFAAAARELGENPPRPARWGGYRVIPDRVEFWQGRPNRLHDRLLYRRAEHGRWQLERLSP